MRQGPPPKGCSPKARPAAHKKRRPLLWKRSLDRLPRLQPRRLGGKGVRPGPRPILWHQTRLCSLPPQSVPLCLSPLPCSPLHRPAPAASHHCLLAAAAHPQREIFGREGQGPKGISEALRRGAWTFLILNSGVPPSPLLIPGTTQSGACCSRRQPAPNAGRRSISASSTGCSHPREGPQWYRRSDSQIMVRERLPPMGMAWQHPRGGGGAVGAAHFWPP